MSAAARFRYTLVAGATAVVIGTGFTVVGLNKHAADVPVATGADSAGSGQGAGAPPVAAGGLPSDYPLADPTAATAASPTPSASATTSAPPTTKATTKAPTRPKPKPTTKAPKPATNPPATSGSILDQVLAHINAARSRNGLSAYTLNSSLSKASALHNQLMIDGCGLSHRCSGEADLGDRFRAKDVSWSSAGENIGYGSSGSSDADIVRAANGLTDGMLAEVPPNDGHRQNLLNSGYQRIGLSVVRDKKGVVWLTQDFVG